MDFLTHPHILLYIAAYLIGSIPFGYLLAKHFAGVNIKEHGSQSIGATNVLRVVKEHDPKLAKKLGASTLALDALKGMIVLFVAHFMGAPESVLWGVAVLAVVGHCYSPFLNFEGGKGVATGLGVLLVMAPLAVLAGVIGWFIVGKVLKISSLASLVGLGATLMSYPFVYPATNPTASMTPLFIIAFVIVYKHIPNIVRMIKKEETKSI
jgi:glycerol-3-phosphate acyltransferase PlsY